MEVPDDKVHTFRQGSIYAFVAWTSYILLVWSFKGVLLFLYYRITLVFAGRKERHGMADTEQNRSLAAPVNAHHEWFLCLYFPHVFYFQSIHLSSD